MVPGKSNVSYSNANLLLSFHFKLLSPTKIDRSFHLNGSVRLHKNAGKKEMQKKKNLTENSFFFLNWNTSIIFTI